MPFDIKKKKLFDYLRWFLSVGRRLVRSFVGSRGRDVRCRSRDIRSGSRGVRRRSVRVSSSDTGGQEDHGQVAEQFYSYRTYW
jgi:hypothetical protein